MKMCLQGHQVGWVLDKGWKCVFKATTRGVSCYIGGANMSSWSPPGGLSVGQGIQICLQGHHQVGEVLERLQCVFKATTCGSDVEQEATTRWVRCWTGSAAVSSRQPLGGLGVGQGVQLCPQGNHWVGQVIYSGCLCMSSRSLCESGIWGQWYCHCQKLQKKTECASGPPGSDHHEWAWWCRCH